ncbi:MAG: hypothetical protein JWR50_48 [Mucilaginibacter sp.]|nr:hypothetical protein [Mucilaginibacter sp.]
METMRTFAARKRDSADRSKKHKKRVTKYILNITWRIQKDPYLCTPNKREWFYNTLKKRFKL